MEGNNPLIQGLNERILIMREQNKQGPARDPDANTQLTMNFQPAVYPEGGLAPTITMQPGAQRILALPECSSQAVRCPCS